MDVPTCVCGGIERALLHIKRVAAKCHGRSDVGDNGCHVLSQWMHASGKRSDKATGKRQRVSISSNAQDGWKKWKRDNVCCDGVMYDTTGLGDQ